MSNVFGSGLNFSLVTYMFNAVRAWYDLA